MSPTSFQRSLGAAGAALAVCVAMTAAPAVAAEALESSLRRAMDDSAAGWSSGDLDRFMSVYENSPDATYVGPKGLVRGYAAIRAMYAPRFAPGGQAPHGTLSFDLLQTTALGTDHALLVGRYHLRPAAAGAGERGGEDVTGIFSLTFHRRDGRWRIVCDHTS